MCRSLPVLQIDFNSHAHVERDIIIHDLRTIGAHFNSHAHVERDEVPQLVLPNILYFNSHAHVERDPSFTALIIHSSISTHTLTWSVTVWHIFFTFLINHFNSHAHVERDFCSVISFTDC